jgi:GT2 family glycosyltransferase
MTSGADNATVIAVTINWNGLNDTIECVESLLAQTHRLAEIIVVDNASDGDDAGRIVELFGPAVTLIRNPSNLGCAGGYNSGIHSLAAHPAPDYILAVNNDVVADPDMVAEMVKLAQSDRTIGVVGPKIFYHDLNGRHDIIWSAGGAIHRWGLKFHTQRGDGEEDGPEFSAARDVDWTSGAAVLMTPTAFKDGGEFNTWYFIGHEDIELCLKAGAAGHRIVYAPRARAWHQVGASAKKVGITYADPAAYFYLIKHTSPTYVYLYHLALFPALLARWGVLYLAKSRDRAQLRRFLADMRRLVSRGNPS